MIKHIENVENLQKSLDKLMRKYGKTSLETQKNTFRKYLKNDQELGVSTLSHPLLASVRQVQPRANLEPVGVSRCWTIVEPLAEPLPNHRRNRKTDKRKNKDTEIELENTLSINKII